MRGQAGWVMVAGALLVGCGDGDRVGATPTPGAEEVTASPSPSWAATSTEAPTGTVSPTEASTPTATLTPTVAPTPTEAPTATGTAIPEPTPTASPALDDVAFLRGRWTAVYETNTPTTVELTLTYYWDAIYERPTVFRRERVEDGDLVQVIQADRWAIPEAGTIFYEDWHDAEDAEAEVFDFTLHGCITLDADTYTCHDAPHIIYHRLPEEG